MYFKIERYIVQFNIKKIIRTGFLREYLFFNVISLLLIVALFIPLIFFLIRINYIYQEVFHREMDFHDLNGLMSDLHLVYLLLILLTLKTDCSFYYPLFRLPVDRRKLVRIIVIKKICLNKFSILLYIFITVIAFTGKIFINSAGMERLNWMVSNFVISVIIGVIAFYSKSIFLRGIDNARVLFFILTSGLLSLLIASHLFISLLKNTVNTWCVLLMSSILVTVFLLMKNIKTTVR